MEKRPDIEIFIRADASFSGAGFYAPPEEKGLKFCLGLASNKRLKKFNEISQANIRAEYLEKGKKRQSFIGPFDYKADSWRQPQKCYAKVESTGKGMNLRCFCSNMEGRAAEELYWDFYVKRGEAGENRIKEVKNMRYSGRLSCHKHTANCMRLFCSCLCYELFRLIRELIKKTGGKEAQKWQPYNIRLFLMKVGATMIKKKRTIRIRFSKSYVCQKLFAKIIASC